MHHDNYESNTNNSNSNGCCSSYSNNYQRSADEISLFVRQILLHSSSSSSSSASSSSFAARSEAPLPTTSFSAPPPFLTEEDGFCPPFISPHESILEAVDVNDECDCESEEGGFEALVDEVAMKQPASSRGSSKRSRAAEVHNLSEKRRRSRINEKMKALQKLIPNSNKTDKASMLDEAIEYLKQLQLQVQMLSMRNGISLHPMCLPGLLQPIQPTRLRMASGDQENGSQHMDISGTLPLHQDSSAQTMFSVPNEHTSLTHLSVPNMSSIINSDTSSCLEPSFQARFGPFPFHTTSEGIHREDVLPNQQINTNHSDSKLSDFGMGVTTSVSYPLRAEAYNLKESSSLETCLLARDQNVDDQIKNVKRNPIPSPEINRIQLTAGRNVPGVETKLEKRNRF